MDACSDDCDAAGGGETTPFSRSGAEDPDMKRRSETSGEVGGETSEALGGVMGVVGRDDRMMGRWMLKIGFKDEGSAIISRVDV